MIGVELAKLSNIEWIIEEDERKISIVPAKKYSMNLDYFKTSDDARERVVHQHGGGLSLMLALRSNNCRERHHLQWKGCTRATLVS
jgi:hypothetical protein